MTLKPAVYASYIFDSTLAFGVFVIAIKFPVSRPIMRLMTMPDCTLEELQSTCRSEVDMVVEQVSPLLDDALIVINNPEKSRPNRLLRKTKTLCKILIKQASKRYL